MIIVGFVLLAAAAVVAVALVIQNPATVTVHAFKWSWDVDMRWLFVAGLALTAIGLLGLAMMRIGGAHYLRLRRDRKVLAAENQRLIERAGAGNARRSAPAESRVPAESRAPAESGAPVESRAPMPVAPMPSAPTPAAPMERPPATRPVPGTAPAGAPMAPATGSVAAPQRTAATSTHPHGIRERLVTRHRHEKG
jgi:uncharacterized integral membrane protein